MLLCKSKTVIWSPGGKNDKSDALVDLGLQGFSVSNQGIGLLGCAVSRSDNFLGEVAFRRVVVSVRPR